MVHIDIETLRRYPILGVLIGLAITVLVVFLLQSGANEARALLGQKAPAVLSHHEVVNQSGVRWVTVSDGTWHCDDAYTITRRGTVARLLFGSIDTIEIPITAGRGDELLVARFGGAVSCADRAHAPLTGVVGSVEIFGPGGAVRRWSSAGRRVAVLNVDASPSKALLLILAMVGVILVGLFMAAYFLKLMVRSGDRQPAPLPLSRPIEPR